MIAQQLRQQDRTLIEKCFLANSFLPRLKGLMGKRTLPDDEAVIFPNCNSIHTFFMLMPIDVILVGRDGMVVRVIERMSPWRMTFPNTKAKHVIEMRAGRASELGISKGMQLNFPGVID